MLDCCVTIIKNVDAIYSFGNLRVRRGVRYIY